MLWGFRRVHFSPDGGSGTSEGDAATAGGADAASAAAGAGADKAPKMTLEEALAKIEELDKQHKITKAEAADKRRKLEALEKAEKDKKDAELPEIERLKKLVGEKDALIASKETELKGLKTRQAWRKVAADAKVRWISPQAEDDAFALVDASALTYNEKGNVVGLKEALDELKKTRPYFFTTAKAEDIDAAAGGGGGKGRTQAQDAALKAKYGV
jgi:hypothetical protein